MRSALFIADLHLDAAARPTLELFQRFCEEQARHADALYVLGDLFEAWIGDDADDLAATTACASFAALERAGTSVWLMHGNRDFLMGDAFRDRCGGHGLPDPSVIRINGRRILLCHGDSLCTADLEYQAQRAHLRSAEVQAELLALPRAQRQTLARQARAASRRQGANKPDAITDVTPEAVDELLDEHDADLIIHGHTHRPAEHRWQSSGRERTRWVVGAWTDHADYVEATVDGIRLKRFPAAPRCETGTQDPVP